MFGIFKSAASTVTTSFEAVEEVAKLAKQVVNVASINVGTAEAVSLKVRKDILAELEEEES